MEIYLNRGGKSEVEGFEIGRDSITVYFTDGSGYRYTDQSAGAFNVQQMKQLAQEGRGLYAFIMFNARRSFAARIR